MKISVCIPTYKRRDLLREALLSVARQSVAPDEVVIGDNSPAADEELMRELPSLLPGVQTRYLHHVPQKGFPGNIEALYQAASSEYSVLLHDDDLLEPEAIASLAAGFVNPSVVATMGRARMINNEGIEDSIGTKVVNDDFYRDDSYLGSVLTPLQSALLQQFPNAGHMVRTDNARQASYAKAAKFYHACDHAFGVLLARTCSEDDTFRVVPEFTYRYRKSDTSISRSKDLNSNIMRYLLIKCTPTDRRIDTLIRSRLKTICPGAIVQACNLGFPKLAVDIYFSEYHRDRILTPGGINRLLKLLRSPFQKKSDLVLPTGAF